MPIRSTSACASGRHLSFAPSLSPRPRPDSLRRGGSKNELVYIQYTIILGKPLRKKPRLIFRQIDDSRRAVLPSLLFSPLDSPRGRAETKRSCPSAAGVAPDPDELVYGPLVPLEASDLVHGSLRVDPGRPGQKRPGHEKLLFFSVRVDQLIQPFKLISVQQDSPRTLI